MNIVVTCGPSFEPIDAARRLTNMSTGKLGVTLAEFLQHAGHEVTCLKGEGSTVADPPHVHRVASFDTNATLARHLKSLARKGRVDAIFHVAALCDYRVEHVLDGSGHPMTSAKFATRDGRLHLVLAPALKVLPLLRTWFPQARIVGWKYELVGTRADALAKAWRQLRECETDACVLNGAAYGAGFALCDRAGKVQHCANPKTLCRALQAWLIATGNPPGNRRRTNRRIAPP